MLMTSVGLGSLNASAATNQFRGVNWADQRDNFQSGVLYIAGLSASDTYSTASAVGEAVMSQFVAKVGANAVRMPINEATVSNYWATYTGAIDAVLSKGMVVLCYWDSAKSNKPSDMNAFWSMWKTVVTKYGSNDNAYFEIFNEPNMYSKTDLVSLYSSWLTQFPTVPKNRVILDGTGNAQNVSDIGSAAALDGCLLGVHDYSFFGSDTWTSESQWVNQFKGEVGSHSDRTVCTEWGGPMSPGSKNGVSYGSLDYSTTPTNYFEAYILGMSSQLRSWNMGNFYWAGLKDGDWYSMTTKSGSGASITLSIPNQSGLDQLRNSWTGTTGGGGAGNGGGSGADGGIGRGGAGGGPGGSNGTSSGGAAGDTAGSTGAAGMGGTGAGRGGSAGTSASAVGGSGGAPTTGSTTSGSGGVVATTAVGSGGTTPVVGGSSGGAGGSSSNSNAGSSGGSGGRGGSDSGGATHPSASGNNPTSGCSCTLGRGARQSSVGLLLLLGLAGLSTKCRPEKGNAR
jgi:hypothetical protein